jgi:ABC-2 type transport system permease protein
MDQLAEFIYMLGIDFFFVAVLIFLMLPLGIYRQAAFAVMKRNFVGYFSNPTGYVFLCLFVLLTAFAAFWPHEFFTANLANFDQLNFYLPYIMLIFIPAITMSIWAEERRQGTDELLLTLPARDIDIVMGKYFAAVLVFTVSLLFSQLSNYAVLIALTGGNLDSGLLFSTYLGYWFIGVAMLAVGMIASFLTNNLTVGFIFGAAFNAPLAFFSNADVVISDQQWVNMLYRWSLLQRLEPFGRGLIAFSSIAYFLGLVAIGIYLCMVLIGRRHWLGGKDGTSMLGHYAIRSVCLIAFAICFVILVEQTQLNQLRLDVSGEKISTVADNTKEILHELESEPAKASDQITVHAYIGNNLPTEYVSTKFNLVNLLREFNVESGGRINVNIHNGIEPFSEEAINAAKRFGIRPVAIASHVRGRFQNQEVLLGVAVTCGLERVVIDFIPYGMPVEYELIRAINTVTKSKRKTIGIVRTNALITGAMVPTQQGNQYIPPKEIVQDLAKQYEVLRVNPEEPIELWNEPTQSGEEKTRKYDVLLVVQPSELGTNGLQNVIAAIEAGQPTAIFEDPMVSSEDFIQPPVFVNGGVSRRTLGTFTAKLDTRLDSGDIYKLWDTLQIQNVMANVDDPVFIWHDYNAYPQDFQLRLAEPESLLLNSDMSTEVDIFNIEDPVTSGISEVVFYYCGAIRQSRDSTLDFTPLVQTTEAGQISRRRFDDAMKRPNGMQLLQESRGNKEASYTIAARITGKKSANQGGEPMNVVYVADTDVLSDTFVKLRNQPIVSGVRYRIQNMSFVMNIIDSLAGEEQFIDIRNRELRHVTLRAVESATSEALEMVNKERQDSGIRQIQEQQKLQYEQDMKISDVERKINQLEKRKAEGQPVDSQTLVALKEEKMALEQRKEQIIRQKMQEIQLADYEKIRKIQLDAELEVQRIQRNFKLAAVVIPPIPPLIVGLAVFAVRRLREREGISKARLK